MPKPGILQSFWSPFLDHLSDSFQGSSPFELHLMTKLSFYHLKRFRRINRKILSLDRCSWSLAKFQNPFQKILEFIRKTTFWRIPKIILTKDFSSSLKISSLVSYLVMPNVRFKFLNPFSCFWKSDKYILQWIPKCCWCS